MIHFVSDTAEFGGYTRGFWVIRNSAKAEMTDAIVRFTEEASV